MLITLKYLQLKELTFMEKNRIESDAKLEAENPQDPRSVEKKKAELQNRLENWNSYLDKFRKEARPDMWKYNKSNDTYERKDSPNESPLFDVRFDEDGVFRHQKPL